MERQSRRNRWIDGEEEDLDLDIENQIQPSIKPTIVASSSADDSPAQAKLRAELKCSGFKICYQSRQDGNSDLNVIDADGSNTVNITRTAGVDEIYPHVSWDGKRLCFTVVYIEKLPNRQTVPCFKVYWMNMNGTARTLVARDATDPCWDPTGTRIAFVKRLSPEKTKDHDNMGLFVYDIYTRETIELTKARLYHLYVPCWSPADGWIVATIHHHPEFHHGIIAFNLQSKQARSLQQCGIDGCRPDLSWDGNFICWNPNDIQIGVTEFKPVAHDKLPLRTVAQAPSPRGSVYFGDWSPNGKYIAYSMNPNFTIIEPKKGGLWDIFVTRVEGGPSVQLTFNHANNKHPEFFSPPQ